MIEKLKKDKLLLEYLNCPILSYCCLCIPLIPAAILIAISGIIPTAACITLATPFGNGFLRSNGFPATYSPVIECIYGVLGTEVFLCHVILFVGVILNNTALILIYLWIIIFYLAGIFVATLIVSSEAISNGYALFGLYYFMGNLLHVVLTIYFWIVVKSLLFVKKEENEIVHINITII